MENGLVFLLVTRVLPMVAFCGAWLGQYGCRTRLEVWLLRFVMLMFLAAFVYSFFVVR
jgi:hypothetical protein